jgi:acetylornithine/succinyldiaminopimelate/putrescine aminotransferase
VDHEEVRPDVLVLGKALSGGTLPVSDDCVMCVLINVIVLCHVTGLLCAGR